MATILREGNLGLLDGKVAVIGYGSQGHAHALNLRDSGVQVEVGPARGLALLGRGRGDRPDGPHRRRRRRAAPSSSRSCCPTRCSRRCSREHIEPNLAPGAAVLFAHGFNIHYERIAPAADHDVIMVAPKGPGHVVRRLFTEGYGTPALIAVQQDAVGQRPRPRARVRGRDRRRRAPASSRRPSRRRPRPTSSASRPSSAAAPPSSSAPASRRSSRPATRPRSPTTSASTS